MAHNLDVRLSPKERWYPESRYGGFSHVDGSLAFYLRINALVEPSFRVLDIGCGRGCFSEGTNRFKNEIRSLRGKVREVVGIDVDPVGATNASLDAFRLVEGHLWPVADGEFDLAFSDSVIEHLEDPAAFFAEAYRTLKPGGVLCVRTPNKLGYVGVLSRLVPNRLHDRVLVRAQDGRKAEDVFPTLYRCNTRRRMCTELRAAGFQDVVVVGHESDPAYLGFSSVAYAVGSLHQRLVPGGLANVLFGFARKGL